jgi:hypothetical protein
MAKAKAARSAKKAAPKTAAKKAKRPAARPRRTAKPQVPLVTLDEPAEETSAAEVPLVTLATTEELQEAPPAPVVQVQERAEAPLTGEWSLPEQFLAVALSEDWDDRSERVKVGGQGAAIAASLLLELAVRGRLRLHLDRFQVTGEPSGDPALDAFAQEVEALADRKAPDAIERLGRKASQHVAPWRGRLHRRGVAQQETWRFLGVFPRFRMTITDPEAKAKLENRLQRTLVGGTPDVRTILLLALIDAAGLLPELIPEGALAYNRKRINALLAGRDPLGYRVDPHIHDLQGVLVAEVLRNVRILQGNRQG